MKTDWDIMARQNPYYYIATRDEFSDPSAVDIEQFFKTGQEQVDGILAMLQVAPNSEWSVLEIGCGLGRLTRHLASQFGRVIGVDVSAEMVARAKHANPNLDIRVCSGVDLWEFADESFDFVFSYIVLQHLPRQKLILKYLEEIARVLKPGGCTIFQLPTSYYPRWKRLYWRAMRQKQQDTNRDRASFRGSCLTAGVIQRCANQLGLQSEIVLNEGSWYTFFKLTKGIDATAVAI